MADEIETLTTTCVIAGGGPAGVMMGYLLARAGIEAVVLEKHGDFLRDFRGDTIHPSTLEVLAELGLLEEFLQRPHQEVRFGETELGGERIRMADFTHLPTRCKFIAFMPQWDFLNFLAEAGSRLPKFRLMMETEATGLLREGEKVLGVAATSHGRRLEIRADLTIAADGRTSLIRAAAGLKVKNLGAPIDVFWFKLAFTEKEHHFVLGRVADGQAMVMLDRGDYWQCALVIQKGAAATIKGEGLEAFRARIAKLAGRPNVDEIESLDEVKLLTVTVDRLERWFLPGLLVIGDAAHAMSPIGGIGINLAIQDAVAAANLLYAPLLAGTLTVQDLQRVQKRRNLPTVVTQAMQVAVQNVIIDPFLRSGKTPKIPGIVRFAQRWPAWQRIPARLIGLGFRPEHVRLP